MGNKIRVAVTGIGLVTPAGERRRKHLEHTARR